MKGHFNWDKKTIHIGGYWSGPGESYEAQAIRVPDFGAYDDSYPLFVYVHNNKCIGYGSPYRNPTVRSQVNQLTQFTPAEIIKFIKEKGYFYTVR